MTDISDDLNEDDNEGEGPTIKMVQVMPNLWQIESPNGFIMQKGIICGNIPEALEYVRSYASSFSWWTYEVVPLKDTKK